MSVWIYSAAIFLIALAAPAWRCARGRTDDRLVALMYSGELATLAFLVMSVAAQRSFYIDCALAAAILYATWLFARVAALVAASVYLA